MLTGGITQKYENPEDPVWSPVYDQTHEESYEFNVKYGRLNQMALMKDKRAKHCLVILEDYQNVFNKLILAIGGVNITYKNDPYQKTTKQIYHDLASVEFYSLEDKKWDRYNARL